MCDAAPCRSPHAATPWCRSAGRSEPSRRRGERQRPAINPTRSQRHAAVDEVRLAGDVARLVGGEEDGERRDLSGCPEPPHGLAVDEALAYLIRRAAGLLRRGRDALRERG